MIGLYELAVADAALTGTQLAQTLARQSIRKNVEDYRRQMARVLAMIEGGMATEQFLNRLASEIALPGFPMAGETDFEAGSPQVRVLTRAGLPDPFAPGNKPVASRALKGDALRDLWEELAGGGSPERAGDTGTRGMNQAEWAAAKVIEAARNAGLAVLFHWERMAIATGGSFVTSRVQVIDLGAVEAACLARDPSYIVANYEAGLTGGVEMKLREDPHVRGCDARILEGLVQRNSRMVATEAYAMEALRLLLFAAEVGPNVPGVGGFDHVTRRLTADDVARLRTVCGEAAKGTLGISALAVAANLAEAEDEDYREPDGRLAGEIQHEVAPEMAAFLRKRPRSGKAIVLGICAHPSLEGSSPMRSAIS